MKIPLVCLSFNQRTYLEQLMLHWRFYHPDPDTHPIIIFDNGSTSFQLLNFLARVKNEEGVTVWHYEDNNFIPNLTHLINNFIKPHFDYYVLSDCDILPHPSTPWNYLDVFKHLIDSGYHRAGFGLITDDLPLYCSNRANIIHNEQSLLTDPITFEFEGQEYEGFRAPIDSTYAMYSTKNSGWYAPMNGKDWSNCIRLFRAFHITWYLDENRLPPEMEYYFNNVKKHVPGTPSAGSNTHRPQRFNT